MSPPSPSTSNRSHPSRWAVQTLALVSSLAAACTTPATDIGGPCGLPRAYGSKGDPCGGASGDNGLLSEHCAADDGGTSPDGGVAPGRAVSCGPGGGQLYYPSGITIDPLDPTRIYVSNGNSDLRYSSGTVMSIDTAYVECALAFARFGYSLTSPGFVAACPNAITRYPFISKIHDAGQRLFGEKYGCRVDLSDPAIIECDEDVFITSSVRVGNFAGTIRVQTTAINYPAIGGNPDGGDVPDGGVAGQSCPAGLALRALSQTVCNGLDGTAPTTVVVATPADCPAGTLSKSQRTEFICTGATRRLWLPVRGDPSLTFINVLPDASGAGVIDCVDEHRMSLQTPNSCAAQRITTRDFHDTVIDPTNTLVADCASDSTKCVSLPSEPFGVFLDEGCPDGKRLSDPTSTCNQNKDTPYAHLLVAHMSTGEVSYINAGAFDPVSTTDHIPKEQVVYDVRGGFFPGDASLRQGSFGLAPREPGNPHSWWYLTSRLNSQIAMFRIADVNVIVPGPKVALNTGGSSGGPFASGNDGRDIVFDPCTPDNPGCRAFVVDNNPPSVLTLDTRIDPTVGAPAGLPRNTALDIVEICQGPSHLVYRSSVAAGVEGPRPVNRIYVTCFTSGQLLVIDPDLSQLVANVLVGRGANEVAFNFGWDEVRGQMLPEGSPPRPRRGYVSNFSDMTIAVLDLEPGSATENRVIGRIGITDPPRVQ